MTLAGAELAVKAADALKAAREINVVRDVQIQQGFRLGEMPHQDTGGGMFADAEERQAAEGLHRELNERFDQDTVSRLGEAPLGADRVSELASPLDESVGSQSPEVQLTERNAESRQLGDASERNALEQEYLSDLRNRVPTPFDSSADTSSWIRNPSTEIADRRLEWTQQKSDLITEWEKNNATEWPRYEADVYDTQTGTKIRLAGDRFDGHHIRPLEYGGANRQENIVPLHANDHYDHRGIHHPDAPLSRLGRLMEA